MVEPDGDGDEGLKEFAVLSFGLRPRLLEQIVALEVQLSIEEIGRPKEKLAVDHRSMEL
jgi:hypothetical protein